MILLPAGGHTAARLEFDGLFVYGPAFMKIFLSILMVLLSVSACAPSSETGASSSGIYGAVQEGPLTIPQGTRQFSTDVLLYEGSGAWQPEVASLKQIFDDQGATYNAVSSSELNAMGLDELAKYGAIVFPGGYGDQITASLTTATQTRIRKAVQERGLNYVGFCAGSFIAVAPTPPEGQQAEYGLSIVNGPRLQYYYLEDEFVKQGREHSDWTMVSHSFADGSKREILWYGGPVTPDVAGHVAARYPTGQAAVTQLWSGNGLVVLSATHPTATQTVINSFGLSDSDGLDHDVAWKLVNAAIRQSPLPTL